MSDDHVGLVKVTFELEPSDWHNAATESLWAEPVGEHAYKLQNVPFHVYGVSFHDVVRALEKDGLLVVDGVISRSGHSTYRILLAAEAVQGFDELWQEASRVGCTVERATTRLLAVDVPPEADIHAVYDALAKGEGAGSWDFEEAHVGHFVDW